MSTEVCRSADSQVEAVGAASRRMVIQGAHDAAWRRFRRHPGALAGACILVAVAALALLGQYVAGIDPQKSSLEARLLAPLSSQSGSAYYLGTDHLGRDILSRIVVGAQVSLTVGVLAVLGGGLLGVSLGLIGGYFGGPIDLVTRTVTDIMMSIPFILLALAAVTIVKPSVWSLTALFIVTSWYAYARPVRAMVLSLREVPFIEAARAMGCSTTRILIRHILPNVVGIVAVIGSFEVARIIIVEASLSFLGVGVPPTTPSWGSLIADGRAYARDAWWISALPGVALTVLAVGINLMGDGLRDAFDPTSEHWKMV